MGYKHKIVAFVMLALGAIVIPCVTMASNVDVRILIDVSGSMKVSDPQNLRIPAVRLIAELMPQGATAGIWMFSERIDQLVLASIVDAQWKAAAQKAANKIHSRGQFTDIEAALQVVTSGWGAADDSLPDRHIILLTDGIVDISKQETANAASRKRILENELARIKTVGAQVHTIALSENSDRELMTMLAKNTEGWAEQIDEAATLQRVFLKIFEQAASPDSIPILDNQFKVDGSISEMTILVFHGLGNKPLQLVSPAGDVFQQNLHPKNVNWLTENGYDLVTIGSPGVGTWQINTNPDKDNRVLIVTDLNLETDSLPTNLLMNESILLNAHITEHGQFLQRKDFLELLQAEFMVSGPNLSTPDVSPIPFDPLQFRYVQEYVVDWLPGEYEFVVRINGGTFQREKRAKIKVHGAPITLSNSAIKDRMASEFLVHADENLVAIESLKGSLVVTKPNGASEMFDLPSFVNGNSALTIAMPVNGFYQISAQISGQSTSNRDFDIKTTPLLVEVEEEADAALSTAAINWLHIGIIVFSVNIVISLLFAILWFWLRRYRSIPSSEVVLK